MCALGFLFGAGASLAQADSAASVAPVLELSLREAKLRAASLAPDSLLAVRKVEEARATHVGAGVVMPENPRLAADLRPGLDRSSRGALGASATLEGRFEIAGAPRAREDEASALVTAARADANVTRADVQSEVVTAYVNERIATLRLEQAREAISIGERVLNAALERSHAGAGSDIDVSSARAELAEFRAEQRVAQGERDQAELLLRHLLAIALTTELRLTSRIDDPSPARPIEELMRLTRAHLPDRKAIEARLTRLDASERTLRAEAFPKLGAFLGLDASPRSPVFAIGGLSIELPVAQRNQRARAVLAAERETERDRLQLLEQRLELTLRALRVAYEQHRESYAILTDEGLPAARENFDLVELGWRAGRFDIFRLTAAAQNLVRLKTERLNVLLDLWRKRVVLERMTGGDDDERP